MVTRPQSSPDVFLFQSSVFLIQVKAPEGVTQDLVLNPFGFAGVAFDGHAGTRRGQDVEAVRGTYLVNAKKMGSVADDHDTSQLIGVGDDRESMDGLVRTRAFGLGNNVGLGNADSLEVFFSDRAF